MLTAFMGSNSGMELLISSFGLSPLEEHHAISTASDGLEGVQAHLSWALVGILLHPVHLARTLLHNQVWLPAFERAHQIMWECILPGRSCLCGIHIKGDDIQVRCPGENVYWFKANQKIGGERDLWCDPAQDLFFNAVAAEQRVRHEAPVIEALPRIVLRGRDAWRQDVLPTGIMLAPERGSPGVIKGFQSMVAFL